jgi:mono/diheme cytochrome c family protein
MKKQLRNFAILATAVLAISLSGCGTSQVDLSTVTPAQIQAYASSLTPAQLQAYTAALTPAQIQTIGGSLTLAQLQAIAPFLTLVTNSAAGVSATPDGTALYSTNCAGCHGPLATSSKLGATTARLQSAISGNIGGMGALSATLTVNQIQSIVTALTPPAAGTGTGVVTPVANGTTLYATDCAGCHGALASSSKLGATVARIQSAISGNSGGMGSLSVLSAADVQAIASALAGTGTSTGSGTSTGTAASDGATLFTTYCTSCHRSMGSTSASSIQSAIKSNKGGMSSLSSLTSAQLQAISSYLATAGGSGSGGD